MDMFPFGRGKLDKPPARFIFYLWLYHHQFMAKELIIFNDYRGHRATSDWIPMSDDSHLSFYFVTF